MEYKKHNSSRNYRPLAVAAAMAVSASVLPAPSAGAEFARKMERPTDVPPLSGPSQNSPTPPQYVFLGDMNHADISLRAYISSPQTMAILKKEHIKHLFVEIPVELQPLADRLAKGQMTKQQFTTDMVKEDIPVMTWQLTDHKKEKFCDLTADMITNAHKNGIKVHFVDLNKQIQQRIASLYYSDGPKDNLPDPVEFRMTYDQQIAKMIKETSGRSRSAIFFGADHAAHEFSSETPNQGIANHLGMKNVARIEIREQQAPVEFSSQWQQEIISPASSEPLLLHKLPAKPYPKNHAP